MNYYQQMFELYVYFIYLGSHENISSEKGLQVEKTSGALVSTVFFLTPSLC